MSVLFLDELPLVRMSTFYLRLTDVPFYETGFSNASLINITNVNGSNAIIPGPVGALPLDEFIYYIIGALVLISCIWEILGICYVIIFPRRYLETTRPLTSQDAELPYRTRRPAAPATVATIVRNEIGRYRTEPRYQRNGNYELSLMAKPNMPLPVVRELDGSEDFDDGTALQDIEGWENLVKEKAKLNITIANLQRIAEARRKAGESGAIGPRLHAALQRRAQVENSINATYEKFRDRRGQWSTEEWQIVELIMECSFRSTV